MSLPTGTVTFLFTDIEESIKLWEQHPGAMRDALARYDALMHQCIAAQDGYVFKSMGDAFCAAFHTAPQGLKAALAAQQGLEHEIWGEPLTVKVRMALHTGTADERDGDYFGPPLNRTARLLGTGYGGQTLVSQTVYELTRDALPPASMLQNLGAHSLRDLTRPEQIYQLCHPDLPSDFPALKSLDYLPNNLPLQLTSFIGRENELAQVKDLLSKTRLLTITGSGGCGKTRLSLQAAADVLENYSDGVWLVELAPLTDPALVPQVVANVLGVRDQPGQSITQALSDWLHSKHLLLLLDNCEHLLGACAALANTLLRACPSLKVLASSREALNVSGEQTYRVPSLSLPDPKTTQTPESLSQYEAVRLFIERAILVNADFAVSNTNAPALASICHRVDGIPLAIELAAARIRVLSLDEINTRLDNRFRLLTGGARTALPRQQTLRALIDWSYDLLTEPEKSLLCRLSVFAAGWTLAAAEIVCAGDAVEDWEVLDLLVSLVDKSLVNADEEAGQTRYRLLETVRQYARDRLAESDGGDMVYRSHRDFFLKIAEEAASHLRGPDQGRWLSVLETEHDNLRQALTFSGQDPDGVEKGLRLGGALVQFWWIRGHFHEGREHLAALLSRPEAEDHPVARAEVLTSAGTLAWMQGDYTTAGALLEQSLAIQRTLGNRQGMARCLTNLGTVASFLGDTTLMQTRYEESLALFRELGHPYGIAGALNNLGNLSKDAGDYALAQARYEESLALYRELGDQQGIAIVLGSLGNAASEQGNNEEAALRNEESLAIARELGDRPGIAACLHNLAIIRRDQGEPAVALSLEQQNLTIVRELGDRASIVLSLESLASLAILLGDNACAACLWGAAEASREEIQSPLPDHAQEVYQERTGQVRTALGEAAFTSAWASGRAMSWEQAVEYALGEAIIPLESGDAP